MSQGYRVNGALVSAECSAGDVSPVLADRYRRHFGVGLLPTYARDNRSVNALNPAPRLKPVARRRSLQANYEILRRRLDLTSSSQFGVQNKTKQPGPRLGHEA